MSTYNGEKYVGEQIESILSQTYKNIEIYVRDDGSKDGTIDILDKYAKNNSIHLVKGENKGFIGSFMSLVADSVDSDYYAFSDQDDVWQPNKIEYAVEMLEKEDNSKPNLYFSNYDYYDEDMNYVSHCKDYKKGPSFRNSLVDCITLGFNSVMNKCARDMVVENLPAHSCGHDWWVYMVCAAFGKVIYDKRYTVKYRRLSTSVSPGGKGFIKFQVWRFKKFFVNDYFKDVRGQLKEFYDIYGDELNDNDTKSILLFTGEGSKISKWFKKVFAIKSFRQGFVDEVFIRIVYFIGKL